MSYDPIIGQIIVKAGRDKPIRQRHPWVYSGSIDKVNGDPPAGALVAVHDDRGRFLAVGTYHPASKIRIRLLDWSGQPLDDAFWQAKLAAASQRRAALQLEPSTTAYRLVNAASDGMPGLIVDRYGDWLVLQALTVGIEQRKPALAQQLAALLRPQGIVERSDAAVRAKEGLASVSGLLWGTAPADQLLIKENGISFEVDLLTGHKSGLYLDQRDNRALVCAERFVSGKRVLNLFSYTGGFGVYAAVNGAAFVSNVDSSVPALEAAENNFRHNGVDPDAHDFVAADIFDYLRHLVATGERYDLIVLDPPKFAHSQRDVDKAARGYKDLNRLALMLLADGGYLATFSCSGAISAELFQKIAFAAALDADASAQIMRTLTQAEDHPVALTVPESAYLKGLLLAKSA